MGKNTEVVRYQLFESFNNLVAFTSTKNTFPGTARFTGDFPEVYLKSRLQLAEWLDINVSQIVFPRQTHTNCVAEIEATPEVEIENTDALITNKKGICICVQTADCVPVFLFDPEKMVISVVHSGWRGTVQRIVENAILKMSTTYQSKPENILAAIGPSISAIHYEVGDEVVQAIQKNIPNAETTCSGNGILSKALSNLSNVLSNFL